MNLHQIITLKQISDEMTPSDFMPGDFQNIKELQFATIYISAKTPRMNN